MKNLMKRKNGKQHYKKAQKCQRIHKINKKNNKKKIPKTQIQIQINEDKQEKMENNPLRDEMFIKQQMHNQIFLKFFKQYNFLSCEQQQKHILLDKINKIIQQLNPIKIDKLLILNNQRIWKNKFSFIDSYNYLKMIKYQYQNKTKNIIIQNNGNILCFRYNNERHKIYDQFKGKFITFIERQIIQNRQKFIEKIKLNQTKYDQNNSPLSQISQELLFLSKIYLNNIQKIKYIIENIKQQIHRYSPSLQQNNEDISSINCNNDYQKQYNKIIIQKNLINAFQQNQINQMTYFQKKENQLKQNEVKNQQINNIFYQDRLKQYLKTKKAKKNKGNHLLTACACCFSDKQQLYNPFITCEGCLLRCHRLCLDLTTKKCDNCSYLKISKQKKQFIQSCIICKQKGQMILKIQQNIYAHNFCMLFHGIWYVKRKQLEINSNRTKYPSLKNHLGNQLNQLKVFFEIQFQFQKLLLNSYRQSQFIDQIKKQNSSKNNLMIDEFLSILSDEPSHKYQIDCSNQSQQMLEIQIDKQKYLSKQQQIQSCRICQKSIHHNYFIKCVNCNHKYHVFCAFFEGFSFKNMNIKNKIYFELKCCSATSETQKQRLKRKRNFILNKDNFLFKNL